MLTRNQTAIMTVLARDEQARERQQASWVGRTLGSLVKDVSSVMGQSSAYAAVNSLMKIGFVDERFKGGRGTGGVKHFIWATPDGLKALQNERIMIDLPESEAGATMADMAPADA